MSEITKLKNKYKVTIGRDDLDYFPEDWDALNELESAGLITGEDRDLCSVRIKKHSNNRVFIISVWEKVRA